MHAELLSYMVETKGICFHLFDMHPLSNMFLLVVIFKSYNIDNNITPCFKGVRANPAFVTAFVV